MKNLKYNENEQCWILTGSIKKNLWWAKTKNVSFGSPIDVKFDANYVMEKEEKSDLIRCHSTRGSIRGSIRGWLHTHPGMRAIPSNRDNVTMMSWVRSLGKPLVCCIAGEDGIRAWWYMDDESPPIECQVEKKFSNFLFGVFPKF